MERIQSILSVVLPFWIGILLIYTFEMNPLIGFFISFVLWRLMTLGGKQKLNKKKLLLIGLLISVSGNYKAEEFILNALVGMTAFQVINFFTKSEEEGRRNWLPIMYVSLAVFYTLRMTLVFDVLEILIPMHEFYTAIAENLRGNPVVELVIIVNLVVVNAIIFFKRLQNDSALIMGLFSGLCGLEDTTAIILMSMFGKMALRLGKGVEIAREYKKSVQ